MSTEFGSENPSLLKVPPAKFTSQVSGEGWVRVMTALSFDIQGAEEGIHGRIRITDAGRTAF